MSLTANPDVARELWVRVDNYAAKHLLTAATWTEFFTSAIIIYHEILAERSIPPVGNPVIASSTSHASVSGEQRILIREFISFFDDLLTMRSDSADGKYAKSEKLVKLNTQFKKSFVDTIVDTNNIKVVVETAGEVEKKNDDGANQVYFLQIDKDLRALLLEILRTSAVSTVKHFLANYYFSVSTAALTTSASTATTKVDVSAEKQQVWNEHKFTDNIARSLHVSLRTKMNLWVVDDNNWYLMVAHGASYLRSIRPPLLPERQQALLNEVLPTIMHEACVSPNSREGKSGKPSSDASNMSGSDGMMEARMKVFRQLISPLILTIYDSPPLSTLVSAATTSVVVVPTASCTSCEGCCVVM